MNENSSLNQPSANFTPIENNGTMPPPTNAGNFVPLPAPSPASSSKKWLILTIATIGGVGVIAGACILLPRLFGGPDYSESYQLSIQLEDEFDQMWGSSQSSCAAMINDANDQDVAPTTYSQYIDACYQDLVKVWDTSSQLGKSSGITKDSDLKQKFTAFESSLGASLPAKNNLEQMKKTFAAIHEFAIRLGAIDPSSSEADINAAAKVLIDSGSDKWVSFGQEWQTKTLNLSNAYRAYEEVSYSDPQYETIREAYYDSLDDLENFLDGINSEEDDLGGFRINKNIKLD